MPGRDLADHTLGGLVQRDRAFRTAVHRVHELELRHAVVVRGLGLAVHLIDGEHLLVAPRLHERDGRRPIGQSVDRVVERPRGVPPIRPLQLHLVETVLLHPDHGQQRAIGGPCERERVGAIHDHAPSRRRCRRHHADAHHRPHERRDVTGGIHLLRRECGVGRIAILEVQPLHVGEVRDLQPIHRRPHAVGFHGILGRRGDVEQAEGEGSGAVGGHRKARPARRVGRSHVEIDAFGREATQRRRHELIAALRDGRVPRLHIDRIQRDRRGRTPRRQHEPQALSEERGADRGHDERRDDDAREDHRRTPEIGPVDRAPIVHAPHAVQRVLDQTFRERGRAHRARRAPHLHRGDERTAEGRLVLLDVQRHLRVRRRERERTRDPSPHGGRDPEQEHDARGDDRAVRRV